MKMDLYILVQDFNLQYHCGPLGGPNGNHCCNGNNWDKAVTTIRLVSSVEESPILWLTSVLFLLTRVLCKTTVTSQRTSQQRRDFGLWRCFTFTNRSQVLHLRENTWVFLKLNTWVRGGATSGTRKESCCLQFRCFRRTWKLIIQDFVCEEKDFEL